MNLHPYLQLAGDGLLTLPDPNREHFIVGGYGSDHDAGRWWDAMLRLEDAIGFVIPPDIEGPMLRNHARLMDNPDGLLMMPPDVTALAKREVMINPHNFREGLLGLQALVAYRHSRWALMAARRLTATIDRCMGLDGRFAFDQLQCAAEVPLTDDRRHQEIPRDGWVDSTATTGRALEALVWLYEATGESCFFDLATRLARHHLAVSTSEDGRIRAEIIDPVNLGHTHSYLGTMRGLLLYGLLTRDQVYVDRIAETFGNGIKERIIMESGWVAHDLGEQNISPTSGQITGEMGSTSDGVQLALWLGVRAGRGEFLDDVERWVRSRFVPAQLTEAEALEADPTCKTIVRRKGGWGCYRTAHGVKDSTPDVFAAVTHSLCDVYNNIVTTAADELRVNLHFDYEGDGVSVRSQRTDRGHLSVQLNGHGDTSSVALRVPGWAPADSVVLSVDGRPLPITRNGAFVHIAAEQIQEQSLIELTYALPERYSTEVLPTGHRFRIKWRADEIVGIDPRDEVLPFYPPLD
ncbi:MAG: hypothetical protein HQ523_07380 [Lentisphaerae bacterium]|nr:hypothetical protein [Lentisphaerota bacterium]